MNYEEALNYLRELCKFGINLGLERIRKLLNLLDNPHKKIKTIHVAGTNGKGSTTAILASILATAGYKVGIYTSPHLHDYRERIKINGLEISQEDFSEEMKKLAMVIPEVVDEVGENPTEFEVLTALALNYFYKRKVDIAILEVGMGGRLDSTNVIIPEVAVITNISMDHTDYLGSDLTHIAGEKAEIIKKQIPVVISNQKETVEKVLKQKAREVNAPLFSTKESFYEQVSFNSQGQVFNLKTKNEIYENLYLSLLGDHQIENALNAITCLEILKSQGWLISAKDIEIGLAQVKWPGRLEYFPSEPQLLLDGAHNASGALTLSRAIPKYFNYEKLIMVLGILGDKDKEKMLAYLAPLADILIITKPPNPRAGDWQSLVHLAKAHTKQVLIWEDFQKAVFEGFKLAESNDLVCICGSLYLVGESREYVLNTFIQE